MRATVPVTEGLVLEIELPEEATTYGGPSDLYTKIVDRYRLDGDVLHVDRQVFARGRLDNVQVQVTLASREATIGRSDQ